EPRVLARGDPRSDRIEESTAHGVLVQHQRQRIGPALNAPYPSLQVDGLRRQHAEEHLRRPTFHPHSVPPREDTGTCSSTSERDRIGGPVGKRSLTHCAVVDGSRSARKNCRTYSAKSRRRFSSNGPLTPSMSIRAWASAASVTRS